VRNYTKQQNRAQQQQLKRNAQKGFLRWRRFQPQFHYHGSQTISFGEFSEHCSPNSNRSWQGHSILSLTFHLSSFLRLSIQFYSFIIWFFFSHLFRYFVWSTRFWNMYHSWSSPFKNLATILINLAHFSCYCLILWIFLFLSIRGFYLTERWKIYAVEYVLLMMISPYKCSPKSNQFCSFKLLLLNFLNFAVFIN
jgi:hypothetical protein